MIITLPSLLGAVHLLGWLACCCPPPPVILGKGPKAPLGAAAAAAAGEAVCRRRRLLTSEGQAGHGVALLVAAAAALVQAGEAARFLELAAQHRGSVRPAARPPACTSSRAAVPPRPDGRRRRLRRSSSTGSIRTRRLQRYPARGRRRSAGRPTRPGNGMLKKTALSRPNQAERAGFGEGRGRTDPRGWKPPARHAICASLARKKCRGSLHQGLLPGKLSPNGNFVMLRMPDITRIDLIHRTSCGEGKKMASLLPPHPITGEGHSAGLCMLKVPGSILPLCS